jgi:hypothetical protein
MKLDREKIDEVFIGVAIVLLSAGIIGIFTNYSILDSSAMFVIGLFFTILGTKEK